MSGSRGSVGVCLTRFRAAEITAEGPRGLLGVVCPPAAGSQPVAAASVLSF